MGSRRLAIYFLDAQLVEKLWRESEQVASSDRADLYTAAIAKWPGGFEMPTELGDRLEVKADELRFQGVMSEQERDLLLSRLEFEDDKQAIEDLFVRSRAIHRETTL